MLRLASTVYIAVAAMTATVQAPRLELTQVELHERPTSGAAVQQIAEIRLTLINDGTQPVEVRAHSGIVPRLIDSSGKPVVLSDWRNLAGYAPPGLPPPPEAPVRSGERRQLESYLVVRSSQGYTFLGPYGGAELRSGRYRIEVAIDLAPVTRDAWVAAHAAAVVRPGPRPKDPQAEAERAATKFATHWRAVPSFFRGRIEAPPLELVLP